MSKENYASMQKKYYEYASGLWSLEHRDHVVGSFDAHNSWSDYDEYLFKEIITTDKIALDFGTGPGRNIVKFNDRFKQIDGVDIAQGNLHKAKIWCNVNNIVGPKFYMTNGIDLSNIESDLYDIVFSTICFQHISVFDTRDSLLKEMFRVLKPQGNLCMQMGYGLNPNKRTASYFENLYATETNGQCDVRIEKTEDLENHLTQIGFKNFSYDIRPTGPGDDHPNWIFFRAKK